MNTLCRTQQQITLFLSQEPCTYVSQPLQHRKPFFWISPLPSKVITTVGLLGPRGKLAVWFPRKPENVWLERRTNNLFIASGCFTNRATTLLRTSNNGDNEGNRIILQKANVQGLYQKHLKSKLACAKCVCIDPNIARAIRVILASENFKNTLMWRTLQNCITTLLRATLFLNRSTRIKLAIQLWKCQMRS